MIIIYAKLLAMFLDSSNTDAVTEVLGKYQMLTFFSFTMTEMQIIVHRKKRPQKSNLVNANPLMCQYQGLNLVHISERPQHYQLSKQFSLAGACAATILKHAVKTFMLMNSHRKIYM